MKLKGIQRDKHGDGVRITEITTEATSDADGRYRMYVFPDKYDIQAAVPNVGVARVSDVTVCVDEAKSLDIDLKPGVRFEARVIDTNTGKPVEDLVLFNWRDKTVRGISDADGKIVIEGMLPGKYQFNVGHGEPKTTHGSTHYEHGELGRWWSAEAVNEWKRKTIEPGGLQRNFDGLTFDLSVGMAPVKIEVEGGVVFSGHVYDPDGKPVAGATVAPARTGSGNSLTGDTRDSVKTAKDGSYRAVMPAGNGFMYNLFAHDGDYSHWRKWANGASDPLKTEPNQQFSEFNLTLTRGATVRGHVVADAGRVVGKREVRAHAADLRENRYYDPTVKVKDDGSFELKFIRPGKNYIQVSPFWLKAADGPSGTSVAVDLKPGEVLEDVELHVAPSAQPVEPAMAQRRFTIKVLNSAGNPAVEQRVTIGTQHSPLNIQPLIGNRDGLAERVLNTAIGGQQFTTSADGTVQVSGKQLFEQYSTACAIVALRTELAEGAFGVLYADLRSPEITLRLAPVCEVTAPVSTADLPGNSPDERSRVFLAMVAQCCSAVSSTANGLCSNCLKATTP